MDCRLLRDVHQLGHADLHAVGHLVGRRCAWQSPDRPWRSQVRSGSVSASRSSERAARSRRDALGVGEEQHRIALGAELDALVDGGQEAAAPARFAAVGLVLAREQHHEAGQVLVLAAQAVGEPRAHARPAENLVAGVHEDLRRARG